MDFARVAVVGAGAMGAQIAMVIALSGRDVHLVDAATDALDRAQQTLDKQMGIRVTKGRLTQAEVDAAFSRLHLGTELGESVRDASLVLEAIVEKLGAKRELFASVAVAAPAEAVLASNSSSFVPSQMADATGNPERFVNLHFFNPALAMKCVEVVGGPDTPDALIDRSVAFVQDIGKVPVVVRKEIPGFIANRILNAVRDEAIRLYEGGYASVSDIDAACRLALGYPMGPFELMDLTGLDIGYLTKKARFEATGDPADAPSRTVSRLVERGQLGRKAGRGFYEYSADGAKQGEAEIGD